MSGPRLLVTGSRDWTDAAIIEAALAAAWIDLRSAGQITLVHGDCARGADRIARNIWRGRGHTDEPHPANWENGRGSGHARNAEMFASGIDLCLAFPTACHQKGCTRRDWHLSHGTAGAIELAHKAGIEVRVYMAGH